MSTNPNALFQFETSKREQCKASILIEGLTGKGKSGLALVLGYALAKNDWKKVFSIDTENRSLRLFSDIDCTSGGKFEGNQLADFMPELGYRPSNYVRFKEAALNAGAEVVINDSISHAWQYQGGLLDMINDLKKDNSRYQKDSYAAWGDETIVREKQTLFQLFRDSRCHVISTVRVKEKMEYDKTPDGKTILVSLGEQEIMQADVKYEPDLVLHMVRPGKVKATEVKYPIARVVKSRYAILEEGQQYEFTPDLCNQIREYLEEGTSPEELLEKQKTAVIVGIKAFLDENPTQKPFWKTIKENHDLDSKEKLENIPLPLLREMFATLAL